MPGTRGRSHDRWNGIARVEIAEVGFRQPQGFVGLHVPRDRQRGIRGPVVGAEELARILDLRGGDVFRRADREPVVRMVGRVQRGNDRHAGKAVGPVLVLLATLVQHDVALILELGIGQRRQQVAHPIGFHPERQLQRVRGDDLPVVRAIGVGRAVEQRSRFLQRMKVAAIVVFRSFEHEVFEQVGETRAARPLVLGPDVIPDVDRDDRTVGVRVDQHVEPVVEPVAHEGNVHKRT